MKSTVYVKARSVRSTYTAYAFEGVCITVREVRDMVRQRFVSGSSQTAFRGRSRGPDDVFLLLDSLGNELGDDHVLFRGSRLTLVRRPRHVPPPLVSRLQQHPSCVDFFHGFQGCRSGNRARPPLPPAPHV
jgi:hypothetical protein